VFGQQKVDDQSNEITALPKLLAQLDITGAVITIDTAGCQTKIAKQIVEQKADYMLSLKKNQGTLHDDVKLFFETQSTCLAIGHERVDGRVKKHTILASSETLIGTPSTPSMGWINPYCCCYSRA
jgi:hypothetical protein